MDNKKLFTLLLPIAVIIVSIGIVLDMSRLQSKVRIPLVTSTAEYDLSQGWNSVSFPLKSSVSTKQLCELAKDVRSVARLHNNEWEYYECGASNPEDNYTIESDMGYMIEMENDATLPLVGKFVRTNVVLDAGLNLVGVSNSAFRPSYANQICHKAVGDNLEVYSVAKWQDGKWDTHFCSDVNTNNFEMTGGRAYLVNVSLENSTQPIIPPLQ